MNYQYKLQAYKGPGCRYTCPSCGAKRKFTRYIDIATGGQLADHVGKCDRENNCSYHFTPKQFFEDNPGMENQSKNIMLEIKEKPLATQVPYGAYMKTLGPNDDNCFTKFLTRLFGSAISKYLMEKYKVGSSKHWPGATIFWQVSQGGNPYAGKIMLYDPLTGKRVKHPFNHITWAHKVAEWPGYVMEQHFFGEHLLFNNDHPVAIVESEKTAMIASMYFPQFVWIAAGNAGGLSEDKCKRLKNKRVVLFPDLGKLIEWEKKGQVYGFEINNLLEKLANDSDIAEGKDLADYLPAYHWKEFALTPALKEMERLFKKNKIDELIKLLDLWIDVFEVDLLKHSEIKINAPMLAELSY